MQSIILRDVYFSYMGMGMCMCMCMCMYPGSKVKYTFHLYCV